MLLNWRRLLLLLLLPRVLMILGEIQHPNFQPLPSGYASLSASSCSSG